MTSLLIADDSPVKTQLLKAMLKKMGWPIDTLTATTTEQAMKVIDDHRDIAFALVDYYIPTQNGPAIIQRLRREHPKCRIALVSSSDSAENKDEAMSLGAESFVCTSWEADRVERELTGLLQTWREEAKAV